MFIEFKNTPFGKIPTIVAEKGDTKKKIKKANDGLTMFTLVNGAFGKNLSEDQFIEEWNRINGKVN